MPHIHDNYDLTVSAFILHPSEPKICMLYHKKHRKWLQPGGHVELHEDPIQALEHELFEETGLKLTECTILEPNDQPKARGQKTLPMPSMFNVHAISDTHKHMDLQYILKSRSAVFTPEEGESPVIAWLTIDEIAEHHKSGEVYDGTLDICEWLFQKFM